MPRGSEGIETEIGFVNGALLKEVVEREEEEEEEEEVVVVVVQVEEEEEDKREEVWMIEEGGSRAQEILSWERLRLDSPCLFKTIVPGRLRWGAWDGWRYSRKREREGGWSGRGARGGEKVITQYPGRYCSKARIWK